MNANHKRLAILLGCVVALATASTSAFAAPVELDLSFDPGSSIDNAVRAVALQPDGKVLIAGDFTTVHGAVRGRVARLNADGTTELTFMNGLAGADATVFALAVQGDGMVELRAVTEAAE